MNNSKCKQPSKEVIDAYKRLKKACEAAGKVTIEHDGKVVARFGYDEPESGDSQ